MNKGPMHGMMADHFKKKKDKAKGKGGKSGKMAPPFGKKK